MNKSKLLKIGIQGVAASFDDVAARNYFQEDIEVLECSTFKILCEKLNEGHASFCMMAIENAIAGSILTNYSLLERYKFKIRGEIYLPISFDLMVLPGQKMGDIKNVQSHPMALYQCEDFLFQHPEFKILEASDTAESAKDIAEKKLMDCAAIASSLAAMTYKLEILKSGIETNKLNYTRFLVICRSADYTRPEKPDKASLRFETPHSPGSLAQVLNIFKKENINLTKIQSIPILGKPNQYSIHVDIEWADIKHYEKALGEIKKITENLFEFGIYKRGEGLKL